jgi:hypothetical protein
MHVLEKKKSYVKPELIAYGNIAKITQGSSTGTVLDQAFPAGTAFTDLTFS